MIRRPPSTHPPHTLFPYTTPFRSVKLSALHPRYEHAKRERVLAELAPRILDLAQRAKQHGIGMTIDAEEADRLELSLDVLEAAWSDPSLSGWDGLGIVVQAYLKRAPFVIDWIADLEIGRASCRERVWHDVYISVGVVECNK